MAYLTLRPSNVQEAAQIQLITPPDTIPEYDIWLKK